MPTVTIDDKGCRGCTLCIDTCPVEVFDLNAETELAVVSREVDCIGCLSCFYLCPSQTIRVGEVELQRPFHRLEQNVSFVDRFLVEASASPTLTAEDWEEALRDVEVTMNSLGRATEEMLGRGSRALGRKSGLLASTHIPEVYEDAALETFLKALQRRFEHSFDFDFELVDGEDQIALAFHPCGLYSVVEAAGETPGETVLCQLFHGYLGGLLAAHSSGNYKHELARTGSNCKVTLTRM